MRFRRCLPKFQFNGNGLDAHGVESYPSEINIASDGTVWFTERFAPQAVGRLDPDTNNVTLFLADGGPEDIVPATQGFPGAE